jgi:hypothetical protein
VCAKSAHSTLSGSARWRKPYSSSDFLSGTQLAVVFSAKFKNLFDAKKITEQPSRAIMSRPAAEVGPPESEYLTVPEIARIIRRNRKTVYGWIVSGGIGEEDGLFVVQGRYLIHWPTFRTRQFKPRVKLRGQLPEYSEESQNGMAGNGQTRPPENRL